MRTKIRTILVLFLLSVSSSSFAKQPIIQYLNSAGTWDEANFVYIEKGESIRLRVISEDSQLVRWYQIIPDTSQFYKNANYPWEENAYKWNGFGKINYERTEITKFRNQQEVEISPELLSKNAPENNPYYSPDLGSFWFDADVITAGGRKEKTPGLEVNDYRGLSPSVFRVSFVEGKDYLGYLTSFFNVPGLFGSVPYQSRNYIGADCADILMAAKSVLEGSNLKDYNVAMLVNSLARVASLNIENGNPDQRLKWGKDIQPGDFIAVKYRSGGQYAHIGALYKDNNQNGILDKVDLVLHAGPHALHYSSLEDGGFDGRVIILDNI